MSFKYSKELTDDEIEKLKITKEQLKNLGRSVMDWKNFTLHWKKSFYCSEELKNC
ncbi:MAG: hypothetical protein KGP29_02435 [Proteobacteria bacterium]|nr:hypothetical protein [Pseudomonadota bacterium]